MSLTGFSVHLVRVWEIPSDLDRKVRDSEGGGIRLRRQRVGTKKHVGHTARVSAQAGACRVDNNSVVLSPSQRTLDRSG